MAKAGFWLRGATGKLAGSALQKGADGSTIIREIVPPSNPQTESQKIQRVIMTTVMQAYSAMKEITDHSFEGLTPGAKTMSKFMALNLNMLRQKVAVGVESGEDIETMYHFCPTGSKLFAPNDYIISAGSLPLVPVVYASTITGATVASAYAGVAVPANTYRSFLETYGLRRGDQITFISVQGNTQAATKFHFARIILDPTNEDGTQASLDAPLIADSAINLPSPRNEGEFAGLIFENGKLFYSFNVNQSVSTAGIIVSRKENDKWLRSNCTLTQREDTILIDGYSLGYCLSNFNATEIGTMNNRILNNAGVGRVASSNVSYLFYQEYTVGEGPETAVREIRITRIEDLGGIYVGYDDRGNYYPISNTNSFCSAFMCAWRTKDKLVKRATVIANWTGFPESVAADGKGQWLADNYISIVNPKLDTERDAEAISVQMNAAVAMGFSTSTVFFGQPQTDQW